MYTNKGGAFRGLGAVDEQVRIAAYNNYLICLGSIASQIDAMYPRVRAEVAKWEAAARAAGVHEANIIQFLGPFNVWEETVTSLSGGTIPREIQRVQQGGAVPEVERWGSGQMGCGPDTLTAYRPPPPPVPPSIESMIAGQGGARTGAAQYSGPISPTVERVSIEIPEAVQKEAAAGLLPGVTTNVNAQYAPEQRAQVLPTVFAAKPTAVNGSGYNEPSLSLTGGSNGVTGSSNTMLLLAGGAALFLLFGKKRRGR